LKPAALYSFPTSEEAALAVPQIVHPGDSVLVKGSRGIRMEAVVEALCNRFPSPDEPGAVLDVD
jgi:UDP-N-acetylmuramyl pentapeptide synthase